MKCFYIFSNSPGEIFSWVKPTVARFHNEFPNASIHIFLTPCQYATGEEKKVCLTFPGVTHVYSPKESMKLLYINHQFSSGIVFYLGGDPLHAKRFSKQTHSKLIGYFEKKVSDIAFDYIYHKSESVDMMSVGLNPVPMKSRHGVCLLPGSRPEHLLVALPLMAQMVENLNDVTILFSPFTTDENLAKFSKQYASFNVKKMTDVNDLAHYKYALTIPGTNTMQCAYFKIPYFMIFPTHDSRILRLQGILGLFLYIPLLGPLLKFIILNLFVRSQKIYSIPNSKLGYKLCPELIGRFSVSDATHLLHVFLNNSDRYFEITRGFENFVLKQNSLDGVIRWIKSN